MQIGEVRPAVHEDFERLRNLAEIHDGWRLDYNKGGTMVWTKSNDVSSFKMVKVSNLSPVSILTIYHVKYFVQFVIYNNYCGKPSFQTFHRAAAGVKKMVGSKV